MNTKITISELNRLTGISRNVLPGLLAKHAVAIEAVTDRKKLVDAAAAIRACLADARRDTSGDGPADLTRERAELTRVQKERAQHELDQMLGRTRPQMPVDEVRGHLRAFGEVWQAISNASANAATGRLLSEFESGRPGAVQQAIAEAVIDGMVSAIAVFCDEMPPPMRDGLIDGIESRSETYPLRAIVAQRASLLCELAAVRESDLHGGAK